MNSIDGIGRPRTARRCSSNWLGNCEIIVTMPVSCGRGRKLGEDRLVAADEELDPEDAVAAERFDDLARLKPGGLQRLLRDRRRLPAFAIIASFLAVTNGGQNSTPSLVATVSKVISLSKAMNSSTITRGRSPRMLATA